MTLQLRAVRESMRAFLTENGVPVMTAWSREGRRRVDRPMAVLDILSFQAEPAGFRNYLGDRFDEVSQSWQELYGQKAQVVFGLTVYSPAQAGVDGCQTVLDGLAQAMGEHGPGGLVAREMSWGPVSFEESLDAFRCEVKADCGALLYAVTDEQGTFLDFEVKGRLTH